MSKSMMRLPKSVRIAITASLISLLIYISYVLRGSFDILIGYFENVPGDVRYVHFTGLVFWLGLPGLMARLVGVLLGLTVAFLLWARSWPFLRVKKVVIAALILESMNFIGLIPSLWFLLRAREPSLAYGYLLQIIFIVPFLWALAYQISRYPNKSNKHQLLKVGGLTFAGYSVALVSNEVSRWATMVSAQSLKFIQGIRAVGFFNALAFMPFAIVFAVAGALRLFQLRDNSAMKWFGAALTVIGLNYTIYLAYSYFVHSLNTLPLVDIWTVPLLAVGITSLIYAFKQDIETGIN